ncbi:MAG: S8 family serine peptidase [Promethearchaeota archaeon]
MFELTSTKLSKTVEIVNKLKKRHIRQISILLLGFFIILMSSLSPQDFQHNLILINTTPPRLVSNSRFTSEEISYQNGDSKGGIISKEGTYFTTWGEITESLEFFKLVKETKKTNSSVNSKIKVDEGKIELVIGFNHNLNINENTYEDILFSSTIEKTVEKLNALIVGVPLTSLKYFFNQWLSLEEVRYIEPNQIYSIELVPDDPDWSTQWGPRTIQADLAWDIQMGDPSTILVAVIDTGIDYNHPDLNTQYVPLGYDWVNDDDDPMDDHSHGTHCAGIIAATINNAMGIAGIANVQIMAEKFLDAGGSGTEDDAAEAIIHAVDQGADILSNSWGGGGPSTILKDAFTYAVDHDVIIVGAAGNSASSSPHYPSAYPEVISVSATDSRDSLASFSNYGSTIEISAPGVDIYSTVPVEMGSYASYSGTSMACPHVSGVAALILSEFPDWTTEQVRIHLREGTDDLGDPGWDQYYGYGRLNAYKAVEPPPIHNLKIYLTAPSGLSPGSSTLVNVSVYNVGQENETNVYAELWINENLVQSTIFPKVISGTYNFFSYNWLVIDEGDFNLTAYVSPVTNESNIIDNYAYKLVIVTYNMIGFISTHGETNLPNNLKRFYENYNYFVDEITSPLTTTLLKNYQYLFVGESGGSWTPSEILAVENYIQDGGVFVGIGDTGPADGTSQIAANHGIFFAGFKSAKGSGPTKIIDPYHPLMKNVTTILLPSPINTLNVNNPAVPIIWDWNGSYIYGAAVDFGSGHLLVLSDDFFDVIYAEDNEVMFANILTWTYRLDHDITVFLEAPINVPQNKLTILNATVRNIGLNDENNVELQIWINKTLKISQNYPSLPVGTSKTLSYSWTPTVKGTFNVTTYVVPVANENLVLNNYDTVSVRVVSDSSIILFDEAHYPVYSIGSNPAYVSAGGYSEFANEVITGGYNIDTIDPGIVIDPSILNGVNVLIIIASQNAYTTAELDAIEAWVKMGGCLLLITDWGTFGKQMDPLAARFEFDFANDRLNDSDDNVVTGYNYRIFYDSTNILSHPITFGVSRVEMYAGDGLVAAPIGEFPIIITDNDGTATWSEGSIASAVSLISVLEGGSAGDGRVCVVGDSNLWDNFSDADSDGDPNFYDSDNEILARNTINWLATVIDNMPPIFTASPSNLTYPEGTTGYTLSWTATDTNPGTYTITRDGGKVASNVWYSGVPINLNVDGLPFGTYIFNCTIFDKIGNSNSHTITVTVVDFTPPEFIITPNDLIYSKGTTGHTLNWVATDTNPRTYIIYRNGTKIETGFWGSDNPITINVDGLAVGSYYFTILVEDLYGNSAIDTVIVTVVDTTPTLTLTSPTDIIYNEKETGYSINWTATSLFPDTYIIYKNGTEIDTGSWTSGDPIIIYVDGLAVGSYNFTIVVEDSYGNSAIDTVIVTVVHITPTLTLTSPTDISYNERETGYNINWTATSLFPDTYIIYKNSTKIDIGFWTSSNPITINVDGLAVGSHNFTIVVEDSYGNSVIDTVIVTVVPITPTLTLTCPTDITYNEKETGYSINWTAISLFPDTYIIYKNGTEIDAGSWISDNSITINVDGLAVGSHNFTIVVEDSYENSVIDTVIVTVIPITPTLTFTTPADITYNEKRGRNNNNDGSIPPENTEDWFIPAILLSNGAIGGIFSLIKLRKRFNHNIKRKPNIEELFRLTDSKSIHEDPIMNRQIKEMEQKIAILKTKVSKNE